jgi:vancomycin permeability regulator SanA
LDSLTLADLKQDIKLKRIYGWALLVSLAFVLVIADAVFAWYCWATVYRNHAQIPSSAIESWLGATVVQVVGVVTIVTKYLFSGRGSRPRS